MPKWSDKRLPAFAACLLVVLSGLGVLSALDRQSLTYDAVKYAPSGYDYLRTGKIRFDPENPPIGKAIMALPLFLIDVDPPVLRDGADERGFATGWDFFFRNKVPGRTLASLVRLPSVIAGMALAGVLFLLARRFFGAAAALWALLLLLTGPMYRALSGMATTDIFLALFFTAGLYGLEVVRSGRGGRRMVYFAGVCAAAGVLTKFSGLLFYPLAAAALFVGRDRRKAATEFAILLGVLVVSVLLVYLAELPRLADGMAYQREVLGEGPPLAFFWGELAHKAWPHYYLVSYFVKTPIPHVLAAAAGLGVWFRSKDRMKLLLVAVPVLLFFAAASTHRYYATRYLFPVYPLIALFAGAAWKYGKKPVRILIVVLGFWQVGLAVWAYPNYLAYMNVPWAAQGHRYLSNSDFDWGQDLPALADFYEREGKPALHLCYFGTAAPEAWGIEAQEIITVPGITSSETILPDYPNKEFLAVSAGCRQYMTVGRPGEKPQRAWAWLDEIEPIRIVGRTIYVYDILNDAPAHVRIGQLHLAQKENKKAIREARRVMAIAPRDSRSKVFWRHVAGKTGLDKVFVIH